MKYFFLVFSMFLFFTAFTQEILSKQLTEFSEIIVVGRYQVTLVPGNEYNATVTINSNDIIPENIQYNFSGETLTLRVSGSSLRDIDVHFEIEVPALNHIQARNGAKLTLEDGFNFNEPLELLTENGGKIQVKSSNSPWVKASVSQGGYIRVNGTTSLAELSVRAGGTIGATDLVAEKVNATVTVGGKIVCHALQNLNAEVRTGGYIYYKGDPEVKEKISLSGVIEKYESYKDE